MPVVLSSKSKRRSKEIDADQEQISKSLKRFRITADSEAESRRQGLEDLRFSIGTGQWDEAVKKDRELQGKPCLTINRAPAFLRQYTGEERQHRPSMLVSPVGSGADVETAKIHQGVLRHIEVASVAEVTYDNAYDMMMRIGWCPWRVKDDYVNERSFDREPRIEAIENPLAVYLSPVRRPDGTDPLWGHVVNDYSKEEYASEFGETDMVTLKFPTSLGNAEPQWVTKDGARVAEYWWIDLNPARLILLDDGTTILRDEMVKADKALAESGNTDIIPMEERIVDERDTVIRKVSCIKHDALRILKRYEYLGKYIPFPEVNGVRLNVDGKVYRAGMVRDYRDAQRIYDFMVTRAVEQVDMVSKDPLWVPDANAQYGEDYRQINRKNFSHVFYKAFDDKGNALPMPQRAGREAPIAAMSQIIQQADYDMKAVIGIYGPSLGEESNGQDSGFAIMTRQQQTDTGAISWHDNLNRAILGQGKILLDLWPRLIPAAKLQRIINPDDSIKHQVVFNSQNSDPADAQAMLNRQQGLKQAYDVGVGEYDIVLSTGPMNKTARAETFKALTAVIQEDPQQMLPMFGDIWAKNADFADADLMEARFKKLLPANLQEPDPADAQAQILQLQSQMQQLTQSHDIMVQELSRASDTIRTKRLDLESRERIALMNGQVQLVLQELKANAAGAQAHLEEVLGAITQQMSAMHEGMTIEQDAGAAPNTPELPNAVEPHVQPITPAAPTPAPQMI